MRKFYEVIQEESSDCGICCLASIIKYYGGDVSLENLRYYTETTTNGTNAYELIKSAKIFGLNGYGKKVEKLDEIKCPFIAHLLLENGFFHFVVINKIKNNFIYMMDPSVGLRKVEQTEFYNIFTGNIICFNCVREIPKINKSTFIKDKILYEIKLNKKQYILLIIINFIILLLTILNQLEIELLNMNIKFFYLLIFIIVFNETLILFKNIFILNKSIRFNKNLINNFILHIFKLPLNYLKLKQKGEITTRFNEINEISNGIINFSIEIIFNFILCICVIFILFFFSINLILIILIFSLIYIILNINIYKKIVRDIRYFINLEESYNSKILDYISNIETIKHLNIYKYFINNVNDNLEQKNYITKTLNKKIYLFSMINNILFCIFLLINYVYLLNSNYDLSRSLVIMTLINFYVNNLKSMIEAYPSLMVYKAYINKNSEFLSFEINDQRKNINTFSKILIKNISYKINDNYILKNIKYAINRKDKIFINGPSGIGKSTLMKILNNEIKRYNGNIFIDSNNIKSFDLSNLTTYVSQNETIFEDSLYNNLCLGKVIEEKDLNLVIKICRLDKLSINSVWINNDILSGGEKNRIVLARSLLHSKNIIILDEVLKEVDYDLEVNIIQDIMKYFYDKTIIYISHKDVSYLFDRVLTLGKEKYYDVRKR